ncbi:tetratricopeptide repeat protein [Rickettsia endosymbiont of Ixodes pacificus]|uniref:tetratricopeptide repeat protein n=1 Tax=Rickettsia endosymbiont of Ixodes pacificus TaxID=1133329 RepID=UPI0009E48823|nr:tetratricopeptide repeat protein [Rickettsia endosymbiont of Ixodes pacificus]
MYLTQKYGFFYLLGKYALALEACNKAIKLNPGYSKAYNNKGIALYYLGKYNLVLESYNKAIELDPTVLCKCSSSRD